MQSKKALLVFAKVPVPGEVKTRLIPFLSEEAAAELYRCMLLDTWSKAACLADVDLFLFYHGGAESASYFHELAGRCKVLPQMGIDLGERMEQAFATVFRCGYGRAAVIGTDSPDLPLAYMEEAFLNLGDEQVQTVFGPSQDGGYYLLGMKQLHAGLFRGIAWSSASVLAESLAAAARLGIRATLLPPWHDVDRADDLFMPELVLPANGAPLTRSFLLDKIGTHFSTSNPYPRPSR